MHNKILFVLLFSVFVGFIALTIRGLIIITPTEVKESEFNVVDSYKGCEVVRYSTRLEARSHYLLYCPQ